MAVRRLIISDLHFGSGDDLLASAVARERIEPELAWADELVINGDLLELVFAPLRQAVDAARPFLALVNRHVGRVRYILGNHDHHLVSLAGDERRFCDVLGTPPPAPFRVAPAERLLHALCPDVDIVTSYPLCELDGIRLMHGHYIAPHLGTSDARLLDRLAWLLTGSERNRERLSVADYEGLIAPLYELMYEIANLTSGPRAQRRLERWLDHAALLARAPQRASQRATQRLNTTPDSPATRVAAAMQAVCRNLAVPAGTVVFGHTHAPLDGVATPDGAHRLFNSGSWVWDRRLREAPGYRANCWPGTVLRATGAELELRALLADCDERDLAHMLGIAPALPHGGRVRPRLAAARR